MLTDGVSMSIPAKMEEKKYLVWQMVTRSCCCCCCKKKNLQRDDGEHLQRRENIENMEGIKNCKKRIRNERIKNIYGEEREYRKYESNNQSYI
jgi:tyrosyl-tRNA synthetase